MTSKDKLNKLYRMIIIDYPHADATLAIVERWKKEIEADLDRLEEQNRVVNVIKEKMFICKQWIPGKNKFVDIGYVIMEPIGMFNQTKKPDESQLLTEEEHKEIGKVFEKDPKRIATKDEKYDRVISFLKTHPTHLAAILGFEDYETFKIYYSPEYTKDVSEEIFNLVKEVFNNAKKD